MHPLEFPGADSPDFPRVRLTVPDGWTQVVEPGAVLAALDSAPTREFTANVVVTVARHPSSYALDDAARVMRDELSQLREAAMLPSPDHPPGSDRTLQVVSFVDARIGTLLQIHALIRVSSGPVADFVHLTGTCGGDSTDVDYPVLMEVLESFAAVAAG